MSDINPLVLQRSTEHFAHHRSLSLTQDLALHQLTPNAITEVSLKCYGYGYFPQFKVAIKTNLKSYLKQVLVSCSKLSIFKLVLNGFDVGNQYLASIITLIEDCLNDSNSTLTVVWIHTNHLTGCTHDDFVRMLELIQIAGRSLNREEISVQITHWMLDKNFTMGHMEKDIFQFIESSQMGGLNFRKFSLEISSWFLNNNDAFAFLKSGLDNASLLHKLAINDPTAQALTEAYFIQTQNATFQQVSRGESRNQKKVKQLAKRNLYEQIHFYRVKDFQDKIVRMVVGILNSLKEVQDFTIDFRNWNAMFKLQEMGNVLQSKSGAKSEFSFIKKMSRVEKSEFRDERVLRTTYLL